MSENFERTVKVAFRPDESPTIDNEFLADTAEAMVQLAFTQIMLNKYFQ